MPSIEQLAVKYKGKSVSLLRLSCLALSNKTITRTPVDTGTARASWNPKKGAPAASNVYISADNPHAKRNEVASVVNSLDVGDSYSLTNGIPYIRALEYGHSKQATSGMLRRSVAEWQSIVNDSGNKI